MHLSIIIPTYNEAEGIARQVTYLRENSDPAVTEIIVSDGGSTDATLAEAVAAGAIALVSPGKGRAAQMNYGARAAKGSVLYFVHADTRPPVSFVQDIQQAIAQGYGMGRYRTQFDSSKWLLRVNAFFTRFDWFMCYGGDQTLFIVRDIFDKSGGFKEEMRIMEEYEFVHRIRPATKYKVFPDTTLVSARKYDHNNWLRVQMANAKVISLYKKGASQEELLATYARMIRVRKNAF